MSKGRLELPNIWLTSLDIYIYLIYFYLFKNINLIPEKIIYNFLNLLSKLQYNYGAWPHDRIAVAYNKVKHYFCIMRNSTDYPLTEVLENKNFGGTPSIISYSSFLKVIQKARKISYTQKPSCNTILTTNPFL